MTAKLAIAIGVLEEILLEEIKKLPNYGRECNCQSKLTYTFADDDGITKFCVNCGGYVSIS